MKVLKYILLIIIALVAIFFLVGLISPTVSYQSEISVDATANQAWSAMTDESTMSQWLNGYQRTELLEGDENAVGSKSNIYFMEDGNEMVITETITDIQPNKRMAMDFAMAFMSMKYDMTFTETNGKTTITTNTSATGNGAFAKSMTAMMKSAMKEQEDENLQKLKKVVEARR
jgi:uncharacterized protein YndB with AHSA1/START domain